MLAVFDLSYCKYNDADDHGDVGRYSGGNVLWLLLFVLFSATVYVFVCIGLSTSLSLISFLLRPSSDVNGHSYLKEIKIINFYDFNKLKIIVFICMAVFAKRDGDYNSLQWFHNETTFPII